MPRAQRLFIFVVFAAFLVIGIGTHEYRPHNQQRQTTAEHQTKQDQISPPRDVNERIAEYTFWLVAFTGILAVATIGLGYATLKLWQTTEGHATHLGVTASAAVAAERAYISGGGPAYYGVIQNLGSGAQSVKRFPGGPPNIFEIHVNNYGKTPGELIEIHIGWLDGEIPDAVPRTTSDNVIFYQDWIKPDTASRQVWWLAIPGTLQKPIIFGRFYYRDIITNQLHSSGFILGIDAAVGAQPIRAPRAYTEERHEQHGIPEPIQAIS